MKFMKWLMVRREIDRREKNLRIGKINHTKKDINKRKKRKRRVNEDKGDNTTSTLSQTFNFFKIYNDSLSYAWRDDKSFCHGVVVDNIGLHINIGFSNTMTSKYQLSIITFIFFFFFGSVYYYFIKFLWFIVRIK